MNVGEPINPQDPVDSLVRAYLDRQAERVDSGPVLDRITRSLAQPGERRPKWSQLT